MLVMGLLAIGMIATVVKDAGASAISSNNAAAMLVRITPNVDRGVVISTGDVNLNMGTVDLGASTQTVRPATVTINGNMTATELRMAGEITGGWVFQNFQSLTSTGTNQLNTWATFTSISTVSAPSQGDEYFRVGSSSGAKLLSLSQNFTATDIGITGAGTGTGRFENNEAGSGDMDNMDPGNQRHLWVYFRLPPSTSLSATQSVNFVLSTQP